MNKIIKLAIQMKEFRLKYLLDTLAVGGMLPQEQDDVFAEFNKQESELFDLEGG